MRAYNFVASRIWAIDPSWLKLILSIADRKDESQIRAVLSKSGRPLDFTKTAIIRDQTAVIPIFGPIFPRASFFYDISGATSVEVIAKDFISAIENPSVGSILFNIDSPGGEVTGISELSNMIFEARDKKPITAYVMGFGASAAYFIASAAEEVVLDATAEVGSIGVVAVYEDDKGKKEKQGIRDIEFVSSQSPNKRPNLDTEGGRAQIQARIDRIADVFIESVARNRIVSRETVLKDFGQGGLFVGKDAVSAGLADRLGSLEGVLADLRDRPVAARPVTITKEKQWEKQWGNQKKSQKLKLSLAGWKRL